MEFQIPSGIPFDKYEESLSKGIKRTITNVLGQKAVKSLSTVGLIAGGVAAAYAAFSFFNPDHSRFLGHMPGRGGEFYDWSFTKPEMEWEGIMNTPFTNLNDTEAVHIDMDNPARIHRLLERERKTTKLYMPRKSRIQPVIYDRSVLEF